MPDSRSHRGAHPDDARDFAEPCRPALRSAVAELSWLLGRGYSAVASLTLVGDHHQLTTRQRKATGRAACTDAQRAARLASKLEPAALRGASVNIDGFNCLITLEAMLARAPVFVGRDSATRDLASVHGTYRTVHETEAAVEALTRALSRHGVLRTRLWLDRPVGNSGRLKAVIEASFARSGLNAEVILSDAVDRALVQEPGLVASSDAWVIDHAQRWVDLAQLVAADDALAPWTLDLRD